MWNNTISSEKSTGGILELEMLRGLEKEPGVWGWGDGLNPSGACYQLRNLVSLENDVHARLAEWELSKLWCCSITLHGHGQIYYPLTPLSFRVTLQKVNYLLGDAPCAVETRRRWQPSTHAHCSRPPSTSDVWAEKPHNSL